MDVRTVRSCPSKFLIMRIGIISEGGADTAVITNILKGITGLDSSNFVPLRPRLSFDKTSLQHLDPEQKGGWTLVRHECQDGKKISDFFSLEDSTHVVIHIDSSEAELYGIKRPEKNYHEYCLELRNRIKQEIQIWLSYKYENKILYAIAIEEIDAWVLTLFSSKDTCSFPNAKRRLGFVLSKKGENTTSDYKNYYRLTRAFSKKDIAGNAIKLNCSLNEFYDESLKNLGSSYP